MYDFAGKELKLGDRVITQRTDHGSFVAGEVVRLTPGGAKVATDEEVRDNQIWRNSEILQRPSYIIHLISHNPEREAELSGK